MDFKNATVPLLSLNSASGHAQAFPAHAANAPESHVLTHSGYEIIDSAELGKRWNLPESWVRDQVRRRAQDPIPHIRFGKYVRFAWGSPELTEWLQRRSSSPQAALQPERHEGA
jgi:hypothetical protein